MTPLRIYPTSLRIFPIDYDSGSGAMTTILPSELLP